MLYLKNKLNDFNGLNKRTTSSIPVSTTIANKKNQKCFGQGFNYAVIINILIMCLIKIFFVRHIFFKE